MDFILYKLGDSFVVDFNNIENMPSEMLDVMGGMEVLLKSYFERTNVAPEKRLDGTSRVLTLIREHIEEQMMSCGHEDTGDDKAVPDLFDKLAKHPLPGLP